MNKKEFLAKIASLYQAMNMADSDSPKRADWMVPEMSGPAGCSHLDAMLKAMVENNAITEDERQELYDNL